VAGPQATWTASSDSPWLTVSASGQTGSSLTWQIDPSYIRSATNWVDTTATVTVSAPAPLTPISFPVTASMRLPEVSAVGARLQPAGPATTLVVKGRGFGAIASLASRVSVSGATPSSIQRTSDHRILLSLSGLSAGSHTVAVGNAMGIATGTSDVLAITPTAHAYAAVPTGMTLQALVMDHEHETLYAVHPNGIDASDASLSDGRLMRIRSGAGDTWSVDTPSIIGVDNVGVLLDGDVVVKTSPGTVRVLNRGDLTEKFSLDLTCTGLGRWSFGGIPVTLDGEVWITVAPINVPGCNASPRFGRPGLFNPVTRTFDATVFQNDPTLYGYWADGPDYLMPRDGDRVVLDLSAYFDVSDAAPGPLNASVGSTLLESSSDDGHRMLVNVAQVVVDDQFKTVGQIVIPHYSAPDDSATPLSAVVSPDGTRAYVLTARSSDLGQPSTTSLPRVFVLDISTDVGNTPVPVLGYFELADYPMCTNDPVNCRFYIPAAISMDGATLYFAGGDFFVVAPIPSDANLKAASSQARATAKREIRTVPWVAPGATH
jgi:hypothetical protein